jgi:hypothetical protein
VNSTETGAVRWLSEQNECEWFGLDCGDAYPEGSGAFSPLINIDLSSNNLAGALLPESLEFSSLQGLFLDGNGNIFGTIPSEISTMSQLKFIDVDGNALTGTIPDSFFTLTNLISIDLNSNFLTGSLSEAVGDLSGLEVLQLENNSFGGVLPTDALLGLLRLGTFRSQRQWDLCLFLVYILQCFVPCSRLDFGGKSLHRHSGANLRRPR